MGMQVRYLLELLQLSPFTHFGGEGSDRGAVVDSLTFLHFHILGPTPTDTTRTRDAFANLGCA
jgi:hypothetical protein